MASLAASDFDGSTASSRRGRPTQQRVAEIDAAILSAAVEVFLTSGFDAANMDVIAAKAGVSKGTLYNRHASKDALFRIALEYQLELTSSRASRRNHLFPNSFVPRLRHHAETIVNSFGWAEYRRMERLLETATQSQPDLARLWQDKVSKHYKSLLVEAMQETANIPEGAQIDWAFLAELFLFTLGGWLKAESDRRTVPKDEAMAFADKVIAAVEASLKTMRSRWV